MIEHGVMTSLQRGGRALLEEMFRDGPENSWKHMSRAFFFLGSCKEFSAFSGGAGALRRKRFTPARPRSCLKLLATIEASLSSLGISSTDVSVKKEIAGDDADESIRIGLLMSVDAEEGCLLSSSVDNVVSGSARRAPPPLYSGGCDETTVAADDAPL